MKSMMRYRIGAYVPIEVTGPDRVDYLHRLSSQHFKNAKVGDSFQGAFLNANGTVVSLFTAWVRESSVLLFVEPQSLQVSLAFLEKFHFGENLKFGELKGFQVVECRGGGEDGIPAPNWNGLHGQIFLVKELVALDFLTSAQELNELEYDTLRARQFFPKDRVDIGESNIILEAGLYDYIHRNKGCYPGQEVIERIFTYGNVAKKWVQLHSAQAISPGTDILFEGKKIGQVTSVHQWDSIFLVNGYVQRLHGQKDKELGLGNFLGRVVFSAPDVPKD